MEQEKRYCQYDLCKNKTRALPKIGIQRKNGTSRHADWSQRRYHKQCFKKIEQEKQAQTFINLFSNSKAKTT